MGVVHHASYIPWLEMGRTELLRSSGLSYAKLEAQGVLLVIVKLDVKYRRPARYDDLLEVRTRVTGGSRVKIEHAYEIALLAPAAAPDDVHATEPADAPIILVATTTLACVDRQGIPQPLPAWLAHGLTPPAG
jgi:acyl-CoA thioester hydrolase